MEANIEDTIRELAKNKRNFVFLGEAGSGKSELAINFAKYLAELGGRPVHFFDIDMTKPLFRSRDVIADLEAMGVIFHYEEQFYDAPVTVGGLSLLLKDECSYVVMDVGGDGIGARAIGGYAPRLNQGDTMAYYVLNAFRPWSVDIERIDGTLSSILEASHLHLEQIHMVNNSNNGVTTTPEEAVEGILRMRELMGPYKEVELACVKEDLYEQVRFRVEGPLLPIRLYLTYEWER